jgi:O-succinylbenzoic acid--CoA ligase
MDPPQASAPPPGARLIAVRATGAAAVAAIDRAWDAGDAALPLDPTLPPPVAREVATGLGAHALVSGDGIEPLDGGVATPAGTALVVRTSGTTGTARGVVLSHAALRAGVAASIDRLDAGAGARWLGVLPVHHVAGLLTVLRARAAGTTPILHDRFAVDRVAAEPGGTHVALVPTMLHRLLEHDVDVSRYARILLGGAAAPPDLLARAAASGARVVVSYGMTETAGGCVYDGVPLDGVAVAVDPDGRVLLRGDVLADGYRVGGDLVGLRDDEGWFRSRDLGRFDDGRLVVTGRADDVIVSGGVNVDTSVVADVLRQHRLVADAAVIGVDDSEWGQRAVACVVPVDPQRPPALADLRGHVRALADPAMAPRQLVVLNALPRTALGKVDRRALRADVGGIGS